jgi:hypothetical protein
MIAAAGVVVIVGSILLILLILPILLSATIRMNSTVTLPIIQLRIACSVAGHYYVEQFAYYS